jgi:hypothetical protein
MHSKDLILLQSYKGDSLNNNYTDNLNNVAIDNNHITMLSYDEKDRPYSIDGSKF